MRVGCPYCSKRARFYPTSEAAYNGRDFGPIWACWACEAWVGCHPGTVRPLGRLANKELREWKQKAHKAFDPIWIKRLVEKQKTDPKYNKAMARGGRYRRLAELLGIPREICHIGMFDVELCRRTVEICESGALAGEVANA